MDAERVATSNPAGITAVLSLCCDTLYRKGSGLHYVRIPLDDAAPIGIDRLEVIMTSIADTIRKGTVLLHCASGISRSPIFAAAWMHWCGYRDFDEALVEILALRPIIDPSPVLRNSVRDHLMSLGLESARRDDTCLMPKSK